MTIADAGSCVHHWIIESPNGPTSQGVCKKCGSSKAFDNAVQFTYSETHDMVMVLHATPVQQNSGWAYYSGWAYSSGE